MQQDFILSHYQLGLFIYHAMSKSSIFYIELYIHEEVEIFIRFLDSHDKIIDWHVEKDNMVFLSDFSENDKLFSKKEISFEQFKNSFFDKAPLHQKEFISYLRHYMDIRIEGNHSFSFHKNKISEDIERFWRSSIKSYFLNQKLEDSLGDTSHTLKAEKL